MVLPPIAADGTLRVVALTVRCWVPPSGSDKVNRTSYVVFGVRSKIDPASKFPIDTAGGLANSPPHLKARLSGRNNGMPTFHVTLPCVLYSTVTLQLRLSSPSINQANPSAVRVGGSVTKLPGTVEFAAYAPWAVAKMQNA